MADESERATLRNIIQTNRTGRLKSLLSQLGEWPPRSDPATHTLSGFLAEAHDSRHPKIAALRRSHERTKSLRQDIKSRKLLVYPGISITSNLLFTFLIRRRLTQKVTGYHLGLVLFTTFVFLPLTFVQPLVRLLCRPQLREIADLLAGQRALLGSDPEFRALYAAAAAELGRPETRPEDHPGPN